MTPREHRYVTQADVAREAGVSRPLVSLVMQGSPRVSDDKRARVLEAADQLGYIPNGIATLLAGNRAHHIIGLLAQSLGNPLFVDIFDGLSEKLTTEGHRVVVMQGDTDPAREDQSLRDLVSLRPDGIVLAGYAGSTAALGAAIQSLPFVSVTRRIETKNVAWVMCDDTTGGREATEHLISLGHRHIAHLHLPADIPYDERAQGYRQAMEVRSLEPHLVASELSVEGAHRAVRALFEGDRRPSALVCGNDVMALGALDALHELGLRVPQDVSVVGYDNTVVGARVNLTSVDQHARELGHLAAQAVESLIQGEEAAAHSAILKPLLIVRGTTAGLR